MAFLGRGPCRPTGGSQSSWRVPLATTKPPCGKGGLEGIECHGGEKGKERREKDRALLLPTRLASRLAALGRPLILQGWVAIGLLDTAYMWG